MLKAVRGRCRVSVGKADTSGASVRFPCQDVVIRRSWANRSLLLVRYNSSNAKKVESNKNWGADPIANQYKYWNPHSAKDRGQYSYLIDMSPESIVTEAKVVSLSTADDPANAALHFHGKQREGLNLPPLPSGATLLSVGTTLEEIRSSMNQQSTSPNVLFVSPSCPRTASVLPQVLNAYPSISWIHCRSAGIDFVVTDELTKICTERSESSLSRPLQVTNAKGQFSSSLAEYALLACSYFAKNVPRLVRQQKAKEWSNFNIQELRGKTMGIIGYGDIGRACAKLASEYGMRICALRRHPFLSRDDPLCDVVYGRDRSSLHQLMSESDYIVCSTPSTVETRGMVDAEAFQAVKQDAVFINLGRGPVVDEAALIAVLKNGRLKGAALDVFAVEPLPETSELWNLDNVLLSPHNMDQTATFMHEATEFFLRENLPRFLCGEELLNPVNPILGY